MEVAFGLLRTWVQVAFGRTHPRGDYLMDSCVGADGGQLQHALALGQQGGDARAGDPVVRTDVAGRLPCFVHGGPRLLSWVIGEQACVTSFRRSTLS